MIFLIKRSEIGEKWPLQLPKGHIDIFKRQNREEQSHHTGEAATWAFFEFLLKRWLKRFIKMLQINIVLID